MILLDTNAVIAIINGRPASVREAFHRAHARNEKIAVSSIVVFELWYGARKSRRRDLNDRLLGEFFSGPVASLGFDTDDAAHAGALRAKLGAAGTPIGPYDILIAGQALRHGAMLVTVNAREFARVEGLKWEDWGDVRSLSHE